MLNLFRMLTAILAAVTTCLAHADGTSHTGGANGVDRKVYESYIESAFELPAYKKHLAPLFENVSQDERGSHHFDPVFALTKTWYFAPVDLKRIENEVLGVTFLESTSQQIGVQTRAEIWFDNRIIDPKSDSAETADAILHEIVMSLYLLKFVSLPDLCQQMESLFPETCTKNTLQFELLMTPEPARKLVAKDYENIRFVTNWLKTAANKPIPRSRFIRILQSRGFDRRFFQLDPAADREYPKEISVTRKRFVQLMNGFAAAGLLPQQCTALLKKESRPCQIRFEEITVTWGSLNSPGLRIHFAIANEPEIVMDYPVTEKELVFRPQWDPDRGFVYNLGFANFREKNRIGDRIYNGYLLLRMGAGGTFEDFDFDTLFLKPGVLVSINKESERVCRARGPRILKFTDDALAIRDGDTKPSAFERFFPFMELYAPCTKDNVE